MKLGAIIFWACVVLALWMMADMVYIRVAKGQHHLTIQYAVPDADERKLELAEEQSCDGGVLHCKGNINKIAEEK